MPGISRLGSDVVVEELRPLVEQPRPRLHSILLFGVMSPEEKDSGESFRQSPVLPALRLLREAFGERLLLCVDICLCGYTDHGHCGVFRTDGELDITRSNELLADMAALFAENGADVVCPSDMMDNRVQRIKEELLTRGLKAAILSYSTKF